MDPLQMALVAALGFAVSIFSASVGGTALIMVPLLLALGVEPRVAIATNKFAIIFLSLAAVLRFRRTVTFPPARIIAPLVIPVVMGSMTGAALLVRAPAGLARIIIAVAAIVVAILFSLRRDAGLEDRMGTYHSREIVRTLLVLVPLSVYGGFFTGGHATLLTYVLVMSLGLSFLQGAATTRLLSVFSAVAASIIFARAGVIDYTLSAFLGAAYFAGATLGAHVAVRKGNRWLKTLFLIAVIVLAFRILIMEVIGRLAG